MKKNRLVKRLLACGMAIACALFSIQPVPVAAAQTWPEGPEILSPNAIVMEVNTGTILYEKNCHEEKYPASITKVMTTLLALENCSLDETVVFSADAVFNNEGDTSHIARDYQEELTVEQCLYAIMLESANECAYAIAEHVAEKNGGTYSDFVDMMNAKAKELGCQNTHFNNANGLPDPDHWTSAYDMALIASEAYKNSTFRTICGTTSYTIPATNKHDEPYYCHNHHKCIYPWKSDSSHLYEYCTGGKTGYTDTAGNTLVSYAEKDGITLVCVIMNTASPNQYDDTINLFNWCFENFTTYNISENETSVASDGLENAGLLNSYGSFVSLDQDAYIILPNTASFSDADFEATEGQTEDELATLSYTYGGQPVGSVSIVKNQVSLEESIFETKSLESSDEKVVEIKPIFIFLGLVIFIALLALLYFGKRFVDNFYVIRHRIEVRKMERSRFRVIRNKKKRRRRRDRLFR